MTRTQPITEILHILALGDSYTIGESVPERERWPVLLADRLREHGLPTAAPQVVARTGWTTDELAAAIDQARPVGPFDLVTLLIGVNNQYRGRSLQEYRRQFRNLLNLASIFAGGRKQRVIVLSIPDWGVTPYAAGFDRAKVAQEIDAFNRANREESASAGVIYIDITPISRQVREDAALIAPDGLHPSGKMYAAWVDLVLPEAMRSLQN
jgi:lysophospholipase L1-like esterase